MDKSELKKIKNILEYYLSIGDLKEIPRTGWLNWGIDSNRAEKVADHTLLTQHLAYAIWSEYDIPVNIDRVISMLAFHEIGEPVIGDIPLVHDLRDYKDEMENIAVNSITEHLYKRNYARDLYREFEERKTPEAKFAKFIDKLECDLQSKVYDEENLVDVNDQDSNVSSKVPLVVKLLEEGKSFGEMWMEFGRESYHYPDELNRVSEYAEYNDLHSIKNNHLGYAKKKVKDYLDSIKK